MGLKASPGKKLGKLYLKNKLKKKKKRIGDMVQVVENSEFSLLYKEKENEKTPK
jgi:hypothetical protein